MIWKVSEKFSLVRIILKQHPYHLKEVVTSPVISSYFSLFLPFYVLIYILVRRNLVSRQNQSLHFSMHSFYFLGGEHNKLNKYMEMCTTYEQDAYDIYSQPSMVLGTNKDIITRNAASPPIVRPE